MSGEDIQDIVCKKDNFSVIQYTNVEILQSHILKSNAISSYLNEIDESATYLNIGTGPGFLEKIVANKSKLSLESVEWEEQDILFEPIRTHLNVQYNYLCNSIINEDFNIYNCDKTYDYVLLIRFFPLNKTNSTLDEVKTMLKRFKKYSKKAILIDSPDKYETETVRFFESISTVNSRTIKKIDNWILDLTKI